jgi:hypothetical protein
MATRNRKNLTLWSQKISSNADTLKSARSYRILSKWQWCAMLRLTKLEQGLEPHNRNIARTLAITQYASATLQKESVANKRNDTASLLKKKQEYEQGRS